MNTALRRRPPTFVGAKGSKGRERAFAPPRDSLSPRETPRKNANSRLEKGACEPADGGAADVASPVIHHVGPKAGAELATTM